MQVTDNGTLACARRRTIPVQQQPTVAHDLFNRSAQNGRATRTPLVIPRNDRNRRERLQCLQRLFRQ